MAEATKSPEEKAKQTENTIKATGTDGSAPAAAGKSIIGAKYRDGRYKEQDWLGGEIAKVANTTSEREKKVPVEGQEGAFKTVKETVNDGVNVDRLFALARENGLDVDRFEAQRSSHGFAGRFRMTVRNMLQAEAKRRHGLVIGGKFVSAPADWLSAKGAATNPTHDQKGVKIPVPKPVKADAAPAADAKTAENTTKATGGKPAPAKDAAKK